MKTQHSHVSKLKKKIFFFQECSSHLGEGNGNPLQDSYLENPMDRGAWWATVHGVIKNQTQLSMHTHSSP